jgi:hypothetical protein
MGSDISSRTALPQPAGCSQFYQFENIFLSFLGILSSREILPGTPIWDQIQEN